MTEVYTHEHLQVYRATLTRLLAGKTAQLTAGYRRRAVVEAAQALQAAIWALDLQIAALAAPASDPLPHLPLEPPGATQATWDDDQALDALLQH